MKSLDLDTTRQPELYHRARARVERLLPGWSDQFPSDPAVAILELASYLSDIQNHALDQVGEAHYLAYLGLLGEAPRQLAPARMLAQPLTDGPLPCGTRFWVGGVPFEVTDGWQESANRVTDVSPTASFALPGPSGGVGFVLSLQRPLPAGKPARLWLELQPEPGRNPPDEETPPPVLLRAWAKAGERWREAECADGTCGLLQSGYVTVTPAVQTDTLCLLPDGEPEGTPRLSAAVLEPVALEQRRTRSRCVELSPPFALPEAWSDAGAPRFFVSEGSGWRERGELRMENGKVTGWRADAPPKAVRVVTAQADFHALHTLSGLAAQRVELDEAGVLPQSLRLMVEEDGLWYDCPVREPEENRTLAWGCRWDSGTGTLCFGDGRDFRVPRPGKLLVAGCACCLGSAGNGAGGALELDGVRLLSIRPASGGRDGERAEDAFHRVAAEQAEPLRAVTCQDYERLARRAPGLALDRVRAVTNRALGGSGAGVTVVAKPRSDRPRPGLTRWQAARLRQWLEPFCLLGVPLTVKGPRYCPLAVRARVQADETLDRDRLRTVALSLTDGVTGPLDLGAEVSCAALFSALGAVPGVRRVRWLEVEALSQGGRRTREGGVRLEADALPYLKQFDVTEE